MLYLNLFVCLYKVDVLIECLYYVYVLLPNKFVFKKDNRQDFQVIMFWPEAVITRARLIMIPQIKY